LAVDRQETDPDSMLAFVRRWLAFRNAHPALRHGDIRFLDLPGEVVGFDRSDGGETLRLIFNLGDADAAVRLDEGWTEAFSIGGTASGGTLALPVGSAVVLAR
jgi:alpha-glucosidase